MPGLPGAYHVDSLPWAIGIVLLAMTARYWLAPIRIRFRQTRPAQPQRMVLSRDDEIPAALLPFVATTRRSLTALGYAGFALIRQPAGVALLAEDGSGSIAVGLALPKKDGTVHSLVGFTTQLSDGRKLRTSNAPLPPILPARTGESRLRLPQSRDVAQLHAIHRRRVAESVAAGATIARLSISDPIAYQQREEATSLRHAVQCGYWVQRGERLGLTWKGAFLSAWRLLPPWRDLAVRRDERIARSALSA